MDVNVNDWIELVQDHKTFNVLFVTEGTYIEFKTSSVDFDYVDDTDDNEPVHCIVLNEMMNITLLPGYKYVYGPLPEEGFIVESDTWRLELKYM